MEQRGGWYDWGSGRVPRFRLDAIGEAWTWITREMSVWPVAALL